MPKDVLKTIPRVTTNGEVVEVTDVSSVVRKAAETNRNWDYSQEATKLYRRADVIMDRFYNGVPVPGFDGRLPAPLIAISPQNIKTLAAYRVVPDEYGLPFKLCFNERHFKEASEVEAVAALGLAGQAMIWQWGEWAQMETLTHELGHHWQQLKGKDPYKPGKRITHNKEFIDKLEELGIYSNSRGVHYKEADLDKPFGILVKEWGITRPETPTGMVVPPNLDWWRVFFDLFGMPVPVGRSTLYKYECPECHLKVRIGVKDDPQITHDPCSEKKGQKVFFIRAGAVANQVIFDSDKNASRKDTLAPLPDKGQGSQPQLSKSVEPPPLARQIRVVN